jgi:hypothetical protein
MLVRTLAKRLPTIVAVMVFCVATVPTAPAQSGPVFSTQTPISGIAGSTFTVFLPVFNTGGADATNVQVTSVALGHMSPTNLSLPQYIGTLAVGDHETLDFQFDSTLLAVGGHYLLTARGTYQFGAQTLGFAVNRFVVPSPATGVLLTEIQHWMALDALGVEADSMPGLDRDTDNAALLAFIRSRPDFVDSDIDPDSHSVWATFSDGRLIILGNDFNLTNSAPASSTAIEVPTASPLGLVRPRKLRTAPVTALTTPSTQAPSFTPSELPHSSVVRVISGVTGGGWDASNTAISSIDSWLSAQNYTQAAGADASVASLKTVGKSGSEGVFFIITHGDMGGRNNRQYGLWTSTRAGIDGEIGLSTTENPPGVTDADINGIPPNIPPTLITLRETEEFDKLTNKWRKKWHYAITTQFVQTYFKDFSQASFVFLVACNSDSAAVPVQAFQNALYAKKASVLAGWTNEVNVVKAPTTAQLIFDRLLGANQFAKETTPTDSGQQFKQRPFDYVSASTDMELHDDCPNSDLLGDTACGIDASTGAVLVFNRNPAFTAEQDVFGLLAPSIDQLQIDESSTFTSPPANFILTGLFGSEVGVVTVGGANPTDPTKSTAMTGGRALSACFADDQVDNRIDCGDLPPSGDGSAGNVQVSVRGHNSNIAQLTYWQGPFTFTAAGEDSLKQTVNFNVAFREDIRLHRPVIHYPPVEPSSTIDFPIQAIYPVSTANYSCTGMGLYPTPLPGVISETFTWTGGGTLPLVQGRNAFFTDGFALGGIVVSHTALLLDLSAGTLLTPGCQYKDVILSTDGITTVFDVLPVSTGEFIGPFQVTLDPGSAAIAAITPPNPPPSGAAPCLILITDPCQATITWNQIMPLANTQPDPKSAR